MDILGTLATLYRTKATRRYGLSNVSQLQHALQAAALAEDQGEPACFIAAALLHDVGHMIHGLGQDVARRGVDDTHENRAAEWLGPHFRPQLVEPIRLHVTAKRYLCTAEPGYADLLASDSIRSLRLQGGALPEHERQAFMRHPYFEDAVRLRRLDDLAKDPAAATPKFDHFLQYVEQALIRKKAD